MKTINEYLSRVTPRNTSGRTKARIVAEAEATWMLPVIVGDVMEHGEGCRCMVCFHRAADRAIRAGEEAINDLCGARGVDAADAVFDEHALAR